MLGAHVEPVDVVEEPVERLPDDRQRPVGLGPIEPDRRGHERVTDDADAMRVRDRDGSRQLAGLADPFEARQLAVAVQPVTAGEDRFSPVVPAVGHDDGDPGPDGTAADHQRPVALDDRGVPDPHARDIRDGVERPRTA